MLDYTDLQMPDRLVVVGDIHGHYEGLICLLRRAGLVDGEMNWAGGKAWLIQMGDILGRGARGLQCCRLLMKLQAQAAFAGGAVVCLLGNHEAMATHRELKYVPQEELVNVGGGDLSAAPVDAFIDAMRVEQPVGQWLRNLPLALKLGSKVFVHAALDVRWASMGLRWLNLQANLDMLEDCDYANLPPSSPIFARNGPLWDRRLALADDFEGADILQPVLRQLNVESMIIGHTPTCYMPGYDPGSIVCKFNGSLICTDVGLAPHYGGHVAWLEFVEGQPYACRANSRRPLAAAAPLPAAALL